MTGAEPAVAQPRRMPYPTYRKAFGVALVTASGLAYGLVSQTIDHLLMPGVPLYQPPFGAFGNILMATLIGAALGFIVAWAESAGGAVLWSSLLGALFVAVATLLSGTNQTSITWQKVVAVAIIFVPLAGFVAPMLILFRWAIGREEQNYRDSSTGRAPTTIRRFALPVILVLAAAGLGLLSPYNDLTRAVVPRMNQLILQGRQAQNAQALPAPLRPPDVRQFTEQGRAPYSLEWIKDDENQFAIPRPAGSSFDQSTVIARFDTGYRLVCMFPGKTGQPTCRDFPTP